MIQKKIDKKIKTNVSKKNTIAKSVAIKSSLNKKVLVKGVLKKIVVKRSASKKTINRKKRAITSVDKKQINAVVFNKHTDNPIIFPKENNDWEAWQTFNPGVILLENKIHFLYRAIGRDGISRFGYAASSDGFRINERSFSPVYEHRIGQSPFFNIYSYFSGGSWGGAEDPRIVRVEGEDVLYMTYTACDEGLRMALTSIKVSDFLSKKWNWKPPVLISPPGEVNKNWIIFPEKINGKYAVLHSISPEILIDYFDNLDFNGKTYIQSYYNGKNRKNCWDSWVRGAGAPPIKTKHGWLLFYHAMSVKNMSQYQVGAMLLDLDNPTNILYRSQEPVMEPEEWYENNGFKAGIVYASGVVVKNGLLLLYYGGSDSYVCVAHAPFEEFVEALIREGKPKLKIKIVKKIKNKKQKK